MICGAVIHVEDYFVNVVGRECTCVDVWSSAMGVIINKERL